MKHSKTISLCTVLIFLSISSEVQSQRLFHGRRFGGNVIPPPSENLKQVKDIEQISQKVNHFDPSDTRTFNQNYLINDEYFKSNARNVAYLFISGESDMSPTWNYGGNWISTAKQTGALLAQLEHRYYGHSQPFNDLSTENLKYLTSEQALADLAYFIEFINKKYEMVEDVKWVVFGGSYAGSLAAWMRLKYPHLVTGAISSSGPLEAIVDFQDYMQVVIDNMQNHSEECVEEVQQAFQDLADEVAKNASSIIDLMNVCPFDSVTDNDISNFFESISGPFAVTSQYNGLAPGYEINSLCDVMVQKNKSPIDKLYEAYSSIYGLSCIDINYQTMIEGIKDDRLDHGGAGGMRQWFYQTCNEFGFYQSSSQKKHVFGDHFPVEFSLQMCKDLYGITYDPDFVQSAIDQTNMFYGSLNISQSNIVYIHGSVDPWHALGKLESSVESSPAIFVTGTSHCEDMYAPGVEDSEDLAKAKQVASDNILKWLGF